MAPAVARLGPAMHVTVEDLLPLVAKLTWDERIRLAQLALEVADSELEVADSEERKGPAAAYRIAPLLDHELANSEDPLSWDAEGWEDAERPFPPGVR